MRYVEEGTRFATLEQALDNNTVDELKKLLAPCQTAERPTRKGAIINLFRGEMGRH